MNADTNSNVATDNLNDQVDFGARGESHNHTDGDISYIGKIEKLHDDTFRTGKNHVVLGKGNKVSVNKDGHVEINDNSKQVNLKPEDVTIEKDDQKYIDIDAELDKLGKRSVEWNKKTDTKGVKKHLSDWNNQIIDISGAEIDKANNIYINLDSKILNGAQPITITGLKDGENSPTVIVNVIYQDADKHELNVQTQTKLKYITDTNQFEEENAGSESHKHENHVIWNFGNDLKQLNFTSGYFMGSVLAPKATISCGVNVNGNIIGNTVIISGGENHRWDLHNNGEHHFPFEHNDIDFVIPDPNNKPGNKTPSNKPGDKTPSNKPGDKTPSNKPGNKTPSNKPGDKTPSNKPGNKTPSNKPGDKTPSNKPGDKTPSNKPGDKIPSNKPGDKTPSNKPGDKTPSNKPGDKTPSNKPGDKTPSNKPGNKTPSNKPGDKTPSNKPGDKTPSNKPGDKTPSNKPGDKIPSNKPGDKTPSNKPGDKTPSNKPGDKTPSNKPGDKIPNNKPGDKIPNSPSGKNNDHKKPNFPYNNYYQETSQKVLDKQPNSQGTVTPSSLDKLENKEEYPSVISTTFQSSNQKKQTHYYFYAPLAKGNKHSSYQKFINVKHQIDTINKSSTKDMLPKTGKKSSIFTTFTGIMISIVAVMFLFKEDWFKKNRK